MARMTKAQIAERDEAIAKLREWLRPGDKVYCIVRHVSRSGMQRRIDLYKSTDEGMMFLTGYAAKALGWRWDNRKGGIVVDGCGMDMCFHTVYNLSAILFPRIPGVQESAHNAAHGGYALKCESL